MALPSVESTGTQASGAHAVPASTLDMHEPIIRQEVLENTAVVALGKPIMLGSLDIPGSSHHLDIGLVVDAVR